jgi:hypothetical protein
MLTLVIERRADQRRIVSGYNTIVAAHPAPRQLGSRFQSKARTCPEEGHDAGDRRSHNPGGRGDPADQAIRGDELIPSRNVGQQRCAHRGEEPIRVNIHATCAE